jgi:hypothetical protein
MSESEDLGGDSLADLIDDTDGHEVETMSDQEPTSAIPESAVAEGDDIDMSDPALADIMADDDPEKASPVASPEAVAEAVSAPVATPEGSVDPSSPEDEKEFRAQVSGLAQKEDVDRIIFLRRALVKGGLAAPPLTVVAADVAGTRLISPMGDCDSYGSRPGGRAQGWVTGLAFGSQRRAKNFGEF